MASTEPGAISWYGPGILLCVSPAEQTEPNVRAYYETIGRRLDEGAEPYVMISDTRRMRSLPDASLRRLHGQLAFRFLTEHPRRCARSIVIIESPAVRAVLTAVRWVFGETRVPTETVASFEAAVRLARAKS